jgi:Protein of unknown function (DUF2844)
MSNVFSARQRFIAMAGVSLAALFATPAFATLGGAPMTLPAGASAVGAVSHAAVKASSATSPAAHTVRATTLASGTVVNEYVGADGTVFGVAWQGPVFPDMPSLPGSYFPQYVQGIENQRANGSRGSVSVTDSTLVVHSGGHMGAFAGRAYLPQALPAGVTASDIQ